MPVKNCLTPWVDTVHPYSCNTSRPHIQLLHDSLYFLGHLVSETCVTDVGERTSLVLAKLFSAPSLYRRTAFQSGWSTGSKLWLPAVTYILGVEEDVDLELSHSLVHDITLVNWGIVHKQDDVFAASFSVSSESVQCRVYECFKNHCIIPTFCQLSWHHFGLRHCCDQSEAVRLSILRLFSPLKCEHLISKARSAAAHHYLVIHLAWLRLY